MDLVSYPSRAEGLGKYGELRKKKKDFFKAVAVWVQLYGYTTETLMKSFKKKLDRDDTRMLYVVLNKSWR